MPRLPGSWSISTLPARLRSLGKGLLRRRDIESEMAQEFLHHLELRTEELVRRGLPPDEAARRARIEFGFINSHSEAALASRGFRLFDRIRFSWLDVKLGLRMLMKHPGLSLVSVLGMSVAIAIGAAGFTAISAATNPRLPLHEGDRVVSIQNRDARSSEPDRRALHDFLLWRNQVTSVRDLGAFRTVSRNLFVDGASAPVLVAEMSASGFRVARVSPVLGRSLVEEDEHEGAQAVVVIAHEEWQRRFDGDPDILGRPIRLGSALHVVVGVMPEGFFFPVKHRYWTALRLNPLDHEPGGGPSIHVFGRLAEGASIESAQTELTALGRRMADVSPQTHADLRPQVLPYTQPFLGLDRPAMAWPLRLARIALAMLLVVITVNVAALVYARTATRAGEIAVRSALGASRRRIVIQLFIEALVLSALAAALGLAAAGIALDAAQNFTQQAPSLEFPFWLDFGLSPAVVTYVAGLAIAAGVLVGVVPALKATGRQVQAGLQQLSTRGSQMQLGRTWTALIVAQVAIAVAVLPNAAFFAGQSVHRAAGGASYPAEEILRAQIVMEPQDPPGAAGAGEDRSAFDPRFRDRAARLLERLEADPSVSAVTFSSTLPGYPYARIEAEDGETRWVFIRRVDVGLHAAFDVPLLAGRGFAAADAREGSGSVIVNRVFAEQAFGDGEVLGRRIRYAREGDGDGAETGAGADGGWLEIVGVVPDFMIQADLDPPSAILYEPLALDDAAPPVTLSVRTRGNAALDFAHRIRQIAAEVDPALQLHNLRSAADDDRRARRALGLIALGITAVVLSVVLLSAAGIYAMMSFTVARRRREIGIRSALGAGAPRILRSIFARAGAQLGAGVLVGLLLAALLGGGGAHLDDHGWILLPAVAGLMMLVGLLAALGPARRGLAIEPIEALRED